MILTIFFVFYHNNEKIIKFNAKKGETGPITSTYDGNLIETYFTNPERILQKINDKENNIKFESNTEEVILTINFPDDQEDEFFGMAETIFFDKKEMTIHKILYKAQWKDQIQENEWDISNIQFDVIDRQSFQKQTAKYFDTYEIKTYEPKTAIYYDLMPIGEKAPSLTGFIFPDYANKKEISFDKLTILDFWYTTCFPCIKTIPQLNKLKEKYGDAINIIGVNDIEYKAEQKEKIEAFLKRVPIDYQVLLTKTIPAAYNIQVYPTFYIIGKDGKVKFSQLGYSEENYTELDEVINKLLNE